jgi:hypothetical protein
MHARCRFKALVVEEARAQVVQGLKANMKAVPAHFIMLHHKSQKESDERYMHLL